VAITVASPRRSAKALRELDDLQQ